MDSAVIVALFTFMLCSFNGSVLMSRSCETRPVNGVVKISKGGGAINVEEAPEGAELMTGGGKIHVRSAKHFVEATTGGGDIVIDAVDGSVQATTGAGNVSVTMIGNPNEGQRDVAISSSSGDVTLVVPAGLAMDFDLKLAYTNTRKPYRIVSDFALDQRSTAEWSSAEGTPRKYIYGTGKTGVGSHLIKIHTVNGSIYLKRGQ
ncbi:MAG: DUF4097 family beta strand repeat-containing protein [Pyrinomonadaceae bacterium]